MVSISTIRLCERIFWCKNWTVFCLARLLHVRTFFRSWLLWISSFYLLFSLDVFFQIYVVACVSCWIRLFSVCSFHIEIWCAKVNISSFVSYFSVPISKLISIFQFSQEVCSGQMNVTMCPLCDKSCNFWSLSMACMHIKVTYLFDNKATVFFAVFMSFWGM